jgi:hypothetical protein
VFTNGSGVCSQACDPNAANSCPSSMTCASVDTSHVCIPGAARRGCSAVPGESSPSTALGAVVLLAFASLVAAGARSRRRAARRVRAVR